MMRVCESTDRDNVIVTGSEAETGIRLMERNRWLIPDNPNNN